MNQKNPSIRLSGPYIMVRCLGDYEKDYVVWPIPLEATIQVQMENLMTLHDMNLKSQG